jgi:hypothetical protein
MRASVLTGAAGTLSLLLVGAAPTLAEERFSLAGGQPGTPAYAAAVGLSSLIQFELLPKERVDLQLRATSGPVDNVRLLRQGEVDLAILPAAVGHAARLGTGSFAGDAPATGLRAIAALWRDALHLVVRADDAATGTIDDLSKLQPGMLFAGEVASGMLDASRLLLGDLGLDAERAFTPATLADGDGVAAIGRGEVDAFSATVRAPHAMFDAVFAGASSGLRLLGVTEFQMTRANGNHWLWTPCLIPAATYPGQKDDIRTMALSSLLVVRDDVEPDAVHAMTRAIFENLTYLQRIAPSMADLSLDSALAGVAMPLHAGALRYYSEVGLITMASEDDDRPDAASAERRPAAEIAGAWTAGTGGPLLQTDPVDGTSRIEEPEAPAGGDRSGSAWRRRATI